MGLPIEYFDENKATASFPDLAKPVGGYVVVIPADHIQLNTIVSVKGKTVFRVNCSQSDARSCSALRP
ncbi:hypothetical protein HY029_00865 [Candidatus Gottesmanbacteria bacterium]|nr:hypothetical protein [Candidatus Gottesmanbacteria bacterium]